MGGQLDIGRVISRVFETYSSQASVLFPVALAIFVLEGIVTGILVAISVVLVLVALVVQVIATTLYQGMVVQLVADVQDGRRDTSVEDLFRSVGDAVLPLIGAGIVAGLGIAFGLVLLIVPGLFLLTIWAVVAPVVVLERPGVIAALGRSRELVRGNGWQVFGVIVLFFLILIVASAILGAIGAAFGDAGRIVADIVGSVLTAPLVALAAAVLYFELRALKGETGVPERAVGLQPGGQPAPGQPVPGQPAPGAPGAPPGAGAGPEAPGASRPGASPPPQQS
jgi:hypothetical protein